MTQSELKCLKCGYILRGLRSDGSCPECGTTVQSSLLPRFYWPYLWTVLCCLAFAIFHLLVIGWMSNPVPGARDGIYVLIAIDYPLAVVSTARGVVLSTWSEALWFFGIWGILMYALVGAAIGLVIDAKRRSRFRARLKKIARSGTSKTITRYSTPPNTNPSSRPPRPARARAGTIPC